MRYAILGAAGQLGRALCEQLGTNAVALTRADADLTRPDTVAATLDAVRPDVVVNCAAYNLVDRAESEPDAAFAVNAWAVRDLAQLCAKRDWTLVHFSSDYVFGLDVERHEPWQEAAAPGPVNVYGLSKLAGEYLVRSICPKHFVVRTCGLYGSHGVGAKGGNFVETMLRLAGEGRPLTVVADQVCTPTAVADLVAALPALVASGRFGLYHLTNAGSCSWHRFAAAIFELSGLQPQLTPITSAAYGAKARRPAYSVLSNDASTAAGVPVLRPWREALASYLAARRTFPRA